MHRVISAGKEIGHWLLKISTFIFCKEIHQVTRSTPAFKHDDKSHLKM